MNGIKSKTSCDGTVGRLAQPTSLLIFDDYGVKASRSRPQTAIASLTN
jgi:hypothetical protein